MNRASRRYVRASTLAIMVMLLAGCEPPENERPESDSNASVSEPIPLQSAPPVEISDLTTEVSSPITAPSNAPLPAEGDVLTSGQVLDRLRARLSTPTCIVGPNNTRWRHKYAGYPQHFAQEVQDTLPMMLVVLDQLEQNKLPGEFALIPIVESWYHPEVHSFGGAAGMWQMLSETSRNNGATVVGGFDGRLSALDSTQAAMNYLGKLNAMFNDWRLTAMAYNSGEYRLMHTMSPEELAERSAGGVHYRRPQGLSMTTYEYVSKMRALTCLLAQPERQGIPLDRTVPITHWVPYTMQPDIDSLDELASQLGTDAEALKAFNRGFIGGRVWAEAPRTVLVPASTRPRWANAANQASTSSTVLPYPFATRATSAATTPPQATSQAVAMRPGSPKPSGIGVVKNAAPVALQATASSPTNWQGVASQKAQPGPAIQTPAVVAPTASLGTSKPTVHSNTSLGSFAPPATALVPSAPAAGVSAPPTVELPATAPQVSTLPPKISASHPSSAPEVTTSTMPVRVAPIQPESASPVHVVTAPSPTPLPDVPKSESSALPAAPAPSVPGSTAIAPAPGTSTATPVQTIISSAPSTPATKPASALPAAVSTAPTKSMIATHLTPAPGVPLSPGKASTEAPSGASVPVPGGPASVTSPKPISPATTFVGPNPVPPSSVSGMPTPQVAATAAQPAPQSVSAPATKTEPVPIIPATSKQPSPAVMGATATPSLSAIPPTTSTVPGQAQDGSRPVSPLPPVTIAVQPAPTVASQESPPDVANTGVRPASPLATKPTPTAAPSTVLASPPQDSMGPIPASVPAQPPSIAHLALRTHKVVIGDSLELIAQRFNLNVDDLRTWNHLDKDTKLLVDQILQLEP